MGSPLSPRSPAVRRPRPLLGRLAFVWRPLAERPELRPMRCRLDPGWRRSGERPGLRSVNVRSGLRSLGFRQGPALLALLLILPTRAAEPPLPRPAPSVGTHALIQLAGQPLSGGRSRGTVSLPLERAEGGHTPVLDFQVSGARAAAGPPAAASRQAARIRLLLDTGATSTMVTPELADRLALERRPLPPGAFGLAGGGQGCADLNPQRTRLPDLELRSPAALPGSPGLSLVGVEALVLPVRALPAGVDGVLGVPSLRLMPIRIDPSLGHITLGAAALDQLPFLPNPSSSAPPAAPSFAPLHSQPTSRSSSPSSSATSSVNTSATPQLRLPLWWHRGVPLLHLSSRSGLVKALADTGAEGLFLRPSLAERLQPLGGAQPLRLVGFCGEQRVERRRFDGLGLGPGLGVPSSAPGSPLPGDAPAGVEGIVTENPIFEQLGVEAILGQELLHRHRQLWRLDRASPELLLW